MVVVEQGRGVLVLFPLKLPHNCPQPNEFPLGLQDLLILLVINRSPRGSPSMCLLPTHFALLFHNFLYVFRHSSCQRRGGPSSRFSRFVMNLSDDLLNNVVSFGGRNHLVALVAPRHQLVQDGELPESLD